MTSPPATRRSKAPIATMATAVCALGAAYWMYSDLKARSDRVEARVTELTGQVENADRTLRLLRYEQKSEGLGVEALLEQLLHWAPQIANATTPTAELPAIEKNLNEIIDAFVPHGSEAFARLVQTFRECERGTQDEEQRWLLRAMLEVDPARAEGVLVEVLRGLEFMVSPRMRLFAADQLTERKPELAGNTLRRILESESYRGLDVQRLEPNLLAKYPDAPEHIVHYPGFWNFVQRYAGTDHEDGPQVLLAMLTRRYEHDLMTLQECVKSLGQLSVQDAAEPIRKLFENPPRGHHPMFRNHCLEALTTILGSEACDYLRTAQRNEEHQMIQAKLTELLRRAGC